MPSRISGKRKDINNADLLSSSKIFVSTSEMVKLRLSIEKHGELMIDVARITAAEKMKNLIMERDEHG